jgi:peroxiredoxin Q/BCP
MTCSLLSCFGASSPEPVHVGSAVPAVTCNDETGQAVDVAKEGAKGLLLVYFYPKADTPGCTKQGCSLRDSWAEFGKRGVKVLGVSTDSEADQKAFKEKYKLPFALLADTDKKVCKAFGVSTTLGYASRTAFLFRDGKCIWVDPKSSTADQASVVLSFLESQTK